MIIRKFTVKEDCIIFMALLERKNKLNELIKMAEGSTLGESYKRELHDVNATIQKLERIA